MEILIELVHCKDFQVFHKFAELLVAMPLICRAFTCCRNKMMLSYTLCFFILLRNLSKAATATAAATPAYTATDFILFNCGESSKLNDTSWRSWDSDYMSSHLVSTASNTHSASNVPYEVASFFQSRFTYTFPLQTAGTKFLRLHFHPGVYSNFNTSESFFSVTANGYTLLSNFSAYLYTKNSPQPSFMKEFVINIDGNSLDLTFLPNPKSFAFVNGIEIVSCPDKLYFKGDDVPIKSEEYQLSYLENSKALENVYRLNVGGRYIDIQEDSGRDRGMFRAWSPDDDYISGVDFGYATYAESLHPIKYTTQTPPYSAPPIVYTSSRVMSNTSRSLEWIFPVDSGFSYLLRFHFCEFYRVIKQNQRVFSISINNQTIEPETDVIFMAGGPQIPIFKDYIFWVKDDGRRGKQDMLLSLFRFLEGAPKYASALLNGLEMFKISDSERSLAAANPELATESWPMPRAAKKKKIQGSSIIYSVIGSVIGVIAVVAAVGFSVTKRWRKSKHSATTSASWVPYKIIRHFSLEEIKTATCKFKDNLVIGRGGFGSVYKGIINHGATTVAIKRFNPSSNQGAREFQTEIELLSKLRHLNLVSLLGYCDEHGEMILVYDYMAHGTLRSHLYNTENPPLTWKQRLRICLGAAKGLDYLHTGTEQAIIHRDVKTTNILLDEKWVAKISDFGLSKFGGAETHVSTAVKGSIGYVDPEYCSRQQLTDKSDIYSFGVVLFEVLCARPAIIPDLPREQVNLAEWAKLCFRDGTVEQIIDSNLRGQIADQCLSNFAETAAACLSDKGIDRPAMNDVVGSLEFAVQLQEEAERGDGRC